MKKKLQILVLVIAAISVAGCFSSKVTSFPSELTAFPANEEGTVRMRSSGQGKNEMTASRSAEMKAFNTLLFRGLLTPPQSGPMIEDEAGARKKFASFFENFLEKGGYKNYVIHSSTVGNIQKSGKSLYLVRELTINIRSLRTYLENNSITRKFGY